MTTCFRRHVRGCFRAHALGAVFFLLDFSSGAQAGEPLQAPELLAPPLLPSVESFETPKPPGLRKNTARMMPDVDSWRRGGQARPPNSSRALARMEETAFEELDLLLLWPVRGKISSGFGWRGSGKHRAMHEGIDIPVPRGTPVQAALSGVVAEARVYNGYGKTVILDHGDETRTLYAHCSKIAVKQGEYVEAGQIVAYAGSTGRSTTPHLHFGVIVRGVFRDPVTLLKAGPLRLVRKP